MRRSNQVQLGTNNKTSGRHPRAESTIESDCRTRRIPVGQSEERLTVSECLPVLAGLGRSVLLRICKAGHGFWFLSSFFLLLILALIGGCGVMTMTMTMTTAVAAKSIPTEETTSMSTVDSRQP
jgi:hypothetical protein